MTVTEMMSEFGLRYTSEINLSVPGWEPDEILSFLNNAQRDTIDRLYKEGGEAPLQELIVYDNFSPLSATIADKPILNSEYFVNSLLDPWRFILTVHCNISRTDIPSSTGLKIKAEIIDPAMTGKLIQTVFNTAYFRELYYYMSFEKPVETINPFAEIDMPKLVVIRDSFTTVETADVRYIKEPLTLVENTPGVGETITSELHTKYHDMIVDRAVTLAIEALTNPRLQTQPIVTQS